jgi:hypothetical protein
MRKFLAVALSISLMSCNGMPPIDTGQLLCLATCKDGKCEKKDGVWFCTVTTPVTCPEQCPVGQQCTDPVVGCVPIPPTCSDGLPPGPEGCPKTCADLACLYGCTEPPATCKKPPPQPPIPVVAPLIPDEELTLMPNPGASQMWAETDAAIKSYQILHPEKWIDKSGLQCLSAGPTGIDEAFLGISTELLWKTIVAGQSISQSGQRSDCIFVNRTGGNLYEEMHIFDYSRACAATTSGAYKQLYKRSTGPIVPPEPPPATTCPAPPCPLKTYPDGTAHWRFNAKPHTMGNCDSTPLVVSQAAYCAEVGMPTRINCPCRVEGNPERVTVENWLLDGGPVRDGRNGQDCTPNNTDNPYAFLNGTGDCRICNTPKTVCSEWF